MRILIVSQFHPIGLGGAARFLELSSCWRAAGHDVTILASDLDQHSGEHTTGQERGVIRVPTWGLSKKTRVGRILRDASFARRAVRVGRRLPRPDVVIATSPPLFVGRTGGALARHFRVPMVFDVRDLWPDVAVEFGALRGAAARAAYRMEARIYGNADAIVAVTPGFAKAIVAKGVPASKVHVVPNGAHETFFQAKRSAAMRRKLGWKGVVATYAGAHGPAQGLDQVVAAARLAPGVTFAFVGDGSEKALLRGLAKDLANVLFHDSVRRDDMPALLASSDVALVPLRRMPTFGATFPAKAFEILASGTPMVATAEGDLARMLRASRGARVVPPGDHRALAGAVLDIAAGKGPRRGVGRSFVRREFDRARLAATYLDLLARVQAHAKSAATTPA